MSNFTVVLIVPTGVGAAIGGYAGDALPIARSVATISDRLITHPNVLNGAQLYWSLDNTYYVEGYGLDRFAAGKWGLNPVRQNKIGLLLDQAIEPELRLRHIQVADATRATLGLSLTDYVVTDAPLEVELRVAESGTSWGTIGNPGSLLRAAEKLIYQGGAEAIAVVARFPDDEDSIELQNYRQGAGVDCLAGAEAVISHLIVRNFRIPAAHAPALKPLAVDPQVSPRAAAEELGYTFLPCVLVGLSRAPQFVTHTELFTPNIIRGNEVNVAIVPYTACGGSAMMSFANSTTEIIAVTNNFTQIDVPPEPLGIKVTKVNSYLEALGVLVARKAGIDPQVFHPDLSSLRSL
ncbi:DUF3326 domain-containing protein [Waterburya agarophytonicola K14]|uniref:DUF3326 domain-containing protein n=1 Tax=Waterburya agarophytonicola KI4 TaxID=2874699 RepID=A0A964BSG2_9CYAN|nr:DUF3326 domain-containing protein [Waterburya agarophytonicola]MCC0177392.1 DUF3326 domain-containing protein [Waterburya agarophytonicola KI4]